MADNKDDKPKPRSAKNGSFKKGNQFGRRPRKPQPPNPYDDFQKVMRRTVTIKVDGVPQKVTIRRALLTRLRGEAQKGVRWALRLSQKLIDTMPPPQQYLEAENDKRELENIMSELWREDLRKRYATFKQQGLLDVDE